MLLFQQSYLENNYVFVEGHSLLIRLQGKTEERKGRSQVDGQRQTLTSPECFHSKI